MGKLDQRAQQVLDIWNQVGFNDEPDEYKVEVLANALKQSAVEILDWTTPYVKPYATAWDEGQKARTYLEHVQKFKESL